MMIEKVTNLLETILNTLPITLIYSIPVYFLIACFAFIFWGFSVKTYWKKILLFVVLESFYIDFFIFDLPTYFYFLNSILSYFIFFYFIFYRFKFIYKLAISLFSFITLIFLEIVVVISTIAILSTTREELLKTPLHIVYISLPIMIITLAMIYLLKSRNLSPGKELILSIQKNKRITLLLCILIIQFISICFIITLGYTGLFHQLSQIMFLLLIFSVVISLIVILFTLNTLKLAKNEGVQITQQFYIEDVNKMFTSIRGQRHDFLNHVQVISGLVKLKKYEELSKYTNDLTGEISEVNDILEIGHPALAALIQSKTVISLEKKIHFQYNFNNLHKLSLGVTSIDIIKIIGNLIDNAMQEVEQLPQMNRRVFVSGVIDDDNLVITCKNPCKNIEDIKIKNIFEPGFSTKNENNHLGIGLSIIKQRVDYYKGSIDVVCNNNHEIEFKIALPIKV
ncbi:sensor histidine kinase [Chengkuizengella axinellae]|uniref:GHKL domain-containing protein n=1 Tax=Chengkuizengella axinellae TaxID=3064388 RepID=A0ABT9IT96_9BACL|nr:GHKL domain-containing protein [Chengkuizengella sp. 2205SS18-9]MDP5272558.1 GHKL domain-containing protein [Chengkuizengella sp. 2205SS18-9]